MFKSNLNEISREKYKSYEPKNALAQVKAGNTSENSLNEIKHTYIL